MQFEHNTIRLSRFLSAAVFLLLLPVSYCYSADVVFVRAPGDSFIEQEHLQTAANFYGVQLQTIENSERNNAVLRAAVGRAETLGVVISARALGTLDHNSFVREMQRTRGGIVPLLIVGLEPGMDANLVTAWSGGAVRGCKRLEHPETSQYLFGRNDEGTKEVTRELAGLEIPLASKDVSYLVAGEIGEEETIASVRQNNQVEPAFILTNRQGQKVFAVCANYPGESSAGGDAVVDAFLRNAPSMMFIRYIAGEQGWHALHSYANLTIDDPWLRQPYGYVDYKGMLSEMERHNFHTTIAFIPWNYDRSQPEVVSLFRNRSDRFSISIHGDNHDHKEFTDYRTKPLNIQLADMKQSLARMEKFKSLTGIAYDNVMVFPHSIAPEKTLEGLKAYNYLATVNSTNVPQGSDKPSDTIFDLRPVTLSFAGFPSISRYSIDVPIAKSSIAINAYLGNSLLFYGHSDSFSRGIDSFDGVADNVNTIAPGVKWQGLGEMAKHSYLVKLRSDSNYDVRAFTNTICLDNASGHDSTYYVSKQETDPQILSSITVDGEPASYELRNGDINLTVAVPGGKTRCASILYKNDLNISSTDLARDSLTVYLLRKTSDFRDIYLSKSSTGLALIRFYNRHEVAPVKLVGCALLLLGVVLFSGYRAMRSNRRKHAGDASPHKILPVEQAAGAKACR